MIEIKQASTEEEISQVAAQGLYRSLGFQETLLRSG